ncbi:MAG: MarR family transcriptional regulator [Rhodoglobus sp.]|jgi:DNA-binding MarR family transcriptional regulator|nr:MarR family transcriptional regulator [Rhodoglobus sp.]
MPETSDDDLRLAILRLARRTRAERAGDDVTDGQLSVLFVLWKDGAQTLGSLAERERVTPPSMNRTVNALVEAGLATRDSSPDDGRKVLIQSTEAGLEIAKETKRRRVAWFARQLATLTPDQRAIIDAATPILRELADS